MIGNETHSDSKAATIVIKDLKFTYPGVDDYPPPGSTPLIEDFNLTVCSGHRCLLVVMEVMKNKQEQQQDLRGSP